MFDLGALFCHNVYMTIMAIFIIAAIGFFIILGILTIIVVLIVKHQDHAQMLVPFYITGRPWIDNPERNNNAGTK